MSFAQELQGIFKDDSEKSFADKLKAVLEFDSVDSYLEYLDEESEKKE